MKKDEKQTTVLPFYEPHPPGWLPKVHHSGDLGYPGFHPARPCQDEDVLTLASVQDGLQYKPPISVEYFSYNKMINEKFTVAPDSLSVLEGIMNDIFMRRTDQIPAIPQSTFKIPTRVTLNDAKRQAWFADLANPDVPLHKLGKSVPHGAKGHDLLELLYSNNVAIPRAVWFLRVFGANETAGLRNKPNYVPTQYSVDMAILLTTYMRKQIAEITLPSAPRLGLNIKQIFKGVLADADGRERWMSRFSYCLHLLRTFYAEDLVDHRTFLTWLVNQMMNCNLAQAGFVIRLADEYLGDILASRALTRPLAESCLAKLLEIRMSCVNEILWDTESLLKVTLRRICHALPDTFVSPKLWFSNCTLLEEVLLGSPTLGDQYIEQNSKELKHGLSEIFLDIKWRNEAMMFKDLTAAECSAQLVTAVSCVKLLNSISSDTDMGSVTYFDQDTQNLSDFKVKVDVLLAWSITPLQYGDHRPFAAATLIRFWRNRARDRANRRDTTTPSHFLQDQLFDWLDTSEVAGEARNIGNVAVLFENLVKNETFSYSSYIQRLVARAEPGLCMTDEDSSRHRSFLTWIPLSNATTSLMNQRKVILHGTRSRESPEENVERAIRREIRSLLPELFETASQSNWVSASSLLDSCQTLTKASRFEQVRTFQNWLVPYFKKCLATQQIRFQSLLRTFLVSVELMAHTKCFHSLLELILCMVERCNDVGSMNALVGTFCRYGTVWTCMDTMPMIVQALETAHLAWKSRGVPSRPLLALLMKFDNGRYLSDSSRDKLVADIDAFTAALQPIDPCPDVVPDVLPEILLLAGDPDENAASILANDLWMKYRTSHNWGLKVWDNTVASLRQIPSITEGRNARLACALRYATFLWKIDRNLPNGLDSDVLRWFQVAGNAEILGLGTDAWEVLTAVLLYLAVNSGLKTITILEGLVYPAWHMGGTDNVVEPYLAAANSLCLDLLLREDGHDRVLPPTDFIEVQCLRTKRQDVFEEPHFPLLIASLPALISLENNTKISEDLRLQCTSLRCRLCQDPGFRQGAYRKLDIIRDTFENSPFLMDQGTYSEDLSKREIAGLKVILYDSNDDISLYDWPDAKSLLSPWKIAATTIQMQVNVKQLGRALRQVSMAEAASMNLNKLSSILLRHIKTADEAYYVGEMVRGADFNVASKFINNGLQCMSEILSQHTINFECLQQVGELLRVLVRVSEPFRTVPSSIPAVDPPVQQEFMQAILEKFKLLANCDDLRWKEALILARLLQFILNFKCTWSPGLQQLSAELLNIIFDLLLRCAGADSVDLNLYPVLLDTLLVVVDEMPHDSKLNFDPYRHYPNVSRDAITRDVPPEYRRQILTLLNDLPTESLVTNLIHSQRDSVGRMGFHQPVCSKPWEWIENIGEPSDSREWGREEKIRDRTAHLIKNASSIPLENFGARHTGDTVRTLASEHLSKLESYSRGFEDGLSESVFIRDWRETRLELESELSSDNLVQFRHEVEPKTLVAKASDATKNSMETDIVSQASSSTIQPTQQSPIQGRFSNPSVLDQDATSETSSIFQRSGKRKASTTSSDDEMELIEGEIIPKATAKKQKISRVGKPRKTK